LDLGEEQQVFSLNGSPFTHAKGIVSMVKKKIDGVVGLGEEQ
jgi:hypothetical protein